MGLASYLFSQICAIVRAWRDSTATAVIQPRAIARSLCSVFVAHSNELNTPGEPTWEPSSIPKQWSENTVMEMWSRRGANDVSLEGTEKNSSSEKRLASLWT
ncbi:hypothetical protein MHYP_G00041340 [Metynnis hypsauchen]